MPGWQITIIAVYATVVLIALLRHIVLSRSLATTVFLKPDMPALMLGHATPQLSIFVPAKDEEATIERCLRSLLAQEGVTFELFAVDDRSTDCTAEIVNRIAKEDSRLKLIQITELPPGWTGKTNALQQAQVHAKSDWLLFVDADTIHHPRCIATALTRAQERNLDLFSMLPALEAGSFWEGTIQPFAAACLMIVYPLSWINDPNAKDYAFANGQFILIRRSAYDKIGGHASVKDKFVEDINLARQVRNAGLSLEVAMGPDLFATRMYSSLSSIIKGWSRIFYAAIDGRPIRIAALTAFILIFSVAGYAAVVGGGLLWALGYGCPFTKTIFFLGVAHVLIQMTVFARVYRITKSSLAYLPVRFLAVGAMLWIIAKTLVMCRTHRVEWRGTTYEKGVGR
jgi:chlorobactene glucosyltransferase